MKNKTVVITGGSLGIGLAMAKSFGKAGANVIITGRNQANLQAAAKQLEAQNIKHAWYQADVSSQADNKEMANFAIDCFGHIDVLINNAGISMRALFEDVDTGVIKKLMDVNFMGSVYATKACLPQIIENKGTIVGISSIAGYRGLPARTGYSASKAALQVFLEALRTEMLPYNVNVLTVCPGFTASNIRNTALTATGTAQGETPLDEQKLMPAETVADLTLKAVIARKRTLILTKQGKLTVFLNKWLPKMMDKMVFNHMAKEADSPLEKFNKKPKK